jgi:hypothetical protein
MSNLRRRLRKLESRLLDDSGLIPGTQEWMDFWEIKAARIIIGEEEGHIPIAFVDAMHEWSESGLPMRKRKLTADEERVFARLDEICNACYD